MANYPFDPRRILEEGEANRNRARSSGAPIFGTSMTAEMRKLLRLYIDQRIQVYPNEMRPGEPRYSRPRGQAQGIRAAVADRRANNPRCHGASDFGINDVTIHTATKQAALWMDSPKPPGLRSH